MNSAELERAEGLTVAMEAYMAAGGEIQAIISQDSGRVAFVFSDEDVLARFIARDVRELQEQ